MHQDSCVCDVQSAGFYLPPRLPPYLRKSSMGTTMVVCTVGRTWEHKTTTQHTRVVAVGCVSDCCPPLVHSTACKRRHDTWAAVSASVQPHQRRNNTRHDTCTQKRCPAILTALRTTSSVMVVSGVLGRKNTHGMSGQVCRTAARQQHRKGQKTGKQAAAGRTTQQASHAAAELLLQSC